MYVFIINEAVPRSDTVYKKLRKHNVLMFVLTVVYIGTTSKILYSLLINLWLLENKILTLYLLT